MSLQLNHMEYTRNEWTTVSCFVEMINFLKNKNIEYFADIGSNVGEVSKIFLEEFPSLKKVYAYEPETQNFEFLKQRFSNEPKLIPIKKGIFYGKKNIELYNNGGSGSHTVIVNTGNLIEVIDLVEIENEEIPQLDLVKIDIEGAEYNVLKYSKLLKNIKYLIIEFHPIGMDDEQFTIGLPEGSENHEIRVSYIKKYTDDFVKTYLPNHKIIVELECQYLLELI